MREAPDYSPSVGAVGSGRRFPAMRAAAPTTTAPAPAISASPMGIPGPVLASPSVPAPVDSMERASVPCACFDFDGFTVCTASLPLPSLLPGGTGTGGLGLPGGTGTGGLGLPGGTGTGGLGLPGGTGTTGGPGGSGSEPLGVSAELAVIEKTCTAGTTQTAAVPAIAPRLSNVRRSSARSGDCSAIFPTLGPTPHRRRRFTKTKPRRACLAHRRLIPRHRPRICSPSERAAASRRGNRGRGAW